MKSKIIAVLLGAATFLATAAWAGGVEQGSGRGKTQAEACNSAIEDANKLTYIRRAEVTGKKCEACSVGKDYAGNPEWTCMGFVTWVEGDSRRR